MRVWLLTLLLLLAPMPASAGSSVTYGLTAESPTLGRPIRYALYLPGDAPAPDERWPVVYLLHGLGATDAQWFESGELKRKVSLKGIGATVGAKAAIEAAGGTVQAAPAAE